MPESETSRTRTAFRAARPPDAVVPRTGCAGPSCTDRTEIGLRFCPRHIEEAERKGRTLTRSTGTPGITVRPGVKDEDWTDALARDRATR